jgi:hypothetical protein
MAAETPRNFDSKAVLEPRAGPDPERGRAGKQAGFRRGFSALSSSNHIQLLISNGLMAKAFETRGTEAEEIYK